MGVSKRLSYLRKGLLILPVVCLVLWILGYLFIWQVRDFTLGMIHKAWSQDSAVMSKEEVYEVFADFKVLKIGDLPASYQHGSKMTDSKYRKAYRGATFYEVPREKLYQKVAGQTRIKDLVSRDSFFRVALFDRSVPIYWRVDRKILYKIVELREELARQGYNPDGFKVNHGFRTPRHNEDVGGAGQSRHLYGEAVDMTILDINGDGKYSVADKEIVLDILEKTVISSGGGIGLYPGTRTVHMDVRGYRARWDSY